MQPKRRTILRKTDNAILFSFKREYYVSDRRRDSKIDHKLASVLMEASDNRFDAVVLDKLDSEAKDYGDIVSISDFLLENKDLLDFKKIANRLFPDLTPGSRRVIFDNKLHQKILQDKKNTFSDEEKVLLRDMLDNIRINIMSIDWDV